MLSVWLKAHKTGRRWALAAHSGKQDGRTKRNFFSPLFSKRSVIWLDYVDNEDTWLQKKLP